MLGPITRKVLRFKNRHLGTESCYIFADGVSIKWFDLCAFPKNIFNYVDFHSINRPSFRFKIWNSFKFILLSLYKVAAVGGKKWWRNKIKDKDIAYFNKNKTSDFLVSLSNYPTLRRLIFFICIKQLITNDSDYLRECKANNIGIYEGGLHAAISYQYIWVFDEIYLVGCMTTLMKILEWVIGMKWEKEH